MVPAVLYGGEEKNELMFDQGCNQAAREARQEKIKDLFDPDLYQ